MTARHADAYSAITHAALYALDHAMLLRLIPRAAFSLRAAIRAMLALTRCAPQMPPCHDA